MLITALLVAGVVGIVGFGTVFTVKAWRMAGSASDAHAARSALVGAIGTSMITGLLVGGAVYVFQKQVDMLTQRETEEAVWRANVATSSAIHGFDPQNFSLRRLNLSGKSLLGADLRDADLQDLQMRGTNLRDALLQRADLRGAVLYSADLSRADLTDADLSGAQLQGARFDKAMIERAGSLEGALANPATCWPSGFLSTELARGLVPKRLDDGQGGSTTGVGEEWPDCPPAS